MKLLLVTAYYPPNNLYVASKRWSRLVKHLQELGVSCTVLTPGNTKKIIEKEGMAGENIVALPLKKQQLPAYPSLVKEKIGPPNVIKGLWHFKPTLLDRTLPSWLKTVRSEPYLLDLAQHSDFVISSYNPVGAFVAGWWLAKQVDKPWVADLRDSFDSSFEHYQAHLTQFKTMMQLSPSLTALAVKVNGFAEKWLLEQASLRITIGESLAEYMSRKYNTSFAAVYNGWDDGDLLSKDLSIASPKYILYAGSIHLHQIPAFRILTEALKKEPIFRLRLRLLPNVPLKVIYDTINSSGVSHLVDVLPAVDQSIVTQELSQAVGALVLEDVLLPPQWSKGTVTGKLFGLLISGKPGLVIAHDEIEASKLAKRVDGWYVLNTVEQCCIALHELSKGKSTDTSMLQQYSVLEQAKKLQRLLKGYCKGELC